MFTILRRVVGLSRFRHTSAGSPLHETETDSLDYGL